MYWHDEESIHDAVVEAVASRRLNFSQRPELKTYSNPNKQHNKGVFDDHGRILYPDVVVVDITSNRVAKIGEIETAHTVNEQSAEQWMIYSRLAPQLYLYVPEELESDAVRLLNSYRIPVSGLRIFRVRGSQITFADVVLTLGPPYTIREIRPRPPPEPPIRRPDREPDE